VSAGFSLAVGPGTQGSAQVTLCWPGEGFGGCSECPGDGPTLRVRTESGRSLTASVDSALATADRHHLSFALVSSVRSRSEHWCSCWPPILLAPTVLCPHHIRVISAAFRDR